MSSHSEYAALLRVKAMKVRDVAHWHAEHERWSLHEILSGYAAALERTAERVDSEGLGIIALVRAAMGRH